MREDVDDDEDDDDDGQTQQTIIKLASLVIQNNEDNIYKCVCFMERDKYRNRDVGCCNNN